MALQKLLGSNNSHMPLFYGEEVVQVLGFFTDKGSVLRRNS
jgi:hypothetical protein